MIVGSVCWRVVQGIFHVLFEKAFRLAGRGGGAYVG